MQSGKFNIYFRGFSTLIPILPASPKIYQAAGLSGLAYQVKPLFIKDNTVLKKVMEGMVFITL